MTSTQRYTRPGAGLTGAAPGAVRTRLRTLHLVAGTLLGAYPYLPDAVPGHGALRWSLMALLIPAISVSGIWLWKQALVRRWLRARSDRRQ